MILTASDLAYLGRATFSPYVASKHAVLGLILGEGVRARILVNALCPGPIDTEMLGAASMSAEWRARELDIPLARFGKPEEIAGGAVPGRAGRILRHRAGHRRQRRERHGMIRNPIPWPNAPCAACVTFDMDADSLIHIAHPNDGHSRVSAISMLRYGPEAASRASSTASRRSASARPSSSRPASSIRPPSRRSSPAGTRSPTTASCTSIRASSPPRRRRTGSTAASRSSSG